MTIPNASALFRELFPAMADKLMQISSPSLGVVRFIVRGVPDKAERAQMQGAITDAYPAHIHVEVQDYDAG